MPDYKKMYFMLFNAQTDAIGILRQAQRMTEELYIMDKPAVRVLKPKDTSS